MRSLSRICIPILLSLLLVTVAGVAFLDRSQTHTYAAGAHVALYHNFGRPFSGFLVSGGGFGQNETVTITFDTKAIGTATAVQTKFSQQVNVPGTATPGNHTVAATGQTSGLTAQATFLVQTWWVMFGFDAQNTHYNSDENVINATNVSQLKLNWSYAGDTTNTSPSTPIIRKDETFFTTPNGKVTVLQTSGKIRWFNKLNTTISAIAPAVYYGIVYVGADDGTMYGLNYNTGAVLWTLATGGAIHSSTIIAAGTAYFTSQDGKLYAITAEPTGKVKWTYTTGGPITSTPALGGGNVYFGSQDGKVYAVNNKGVLLWTFDTGSPITSSPTVANGMVYIGSSNHTFYAFNATTGAKVWSYTTGGAISSSPAVDKTNAYIGSEDGKLYAFDAMTGALKWSSSAGGVIKSTPASANGVVYVGSEDHSIYAFDIKNGNKLWSYATGGAIDASPVVSDGVVFIASADGKVYSFH